MDEAQLAKLKAFLETTGLHIRDGYEAGVDPKNVAAMLLLYGVALHERDHGTVETVKVLCQQADKLAQRL